MGRHRSGQVLALLLCALLAACGSDEKKRIGIVFSPNGEPLTGGPLGRAECPIALGGWFDRLRHGGPLTAAIFLADAKRQFVVMDVDRIGLLTPAALARYRAPYEFGQRGQPQTLPSGRDGNNGDNGDGDGRKHSRYRHESDDGDPKHGISHDSSDDQADPVMSADAHNRNEVTLKDFLAYERQNFAALDINHDGQLSREELLAECPD